MRVAALLGVLASAGLSACQTALPNCLYPVAPPAPPAADPATLPVVLVDHDDVIVNHSCRLVWPNPVRDLNDDGVVHIVGDLMVVDLDGAVCRGAFEGLPPDGFTGVGISVRGGSVRLRNGAVSGFKVGVAAHNADACVFEDLDLSGNFAQRLNSTPAAEDASDWLWPHSNDHGEWADNYGAGLSVNGASNVLIERVKVQHGQNGILLSGVSASWVVDCDCSFNSGWGLAMWRCHQTTVCRNAFDFNIRGYSHGVYNRGQDSAGIVMFEQCANNVLALNSCTHCGNGIFAFTGRESLGEVEHRLVPEPEASWFDCHGVNSNRIIGNDCSFAAAHGIELTFGKQNSIENNHCEGNGICGLWGGYSQGTHIFGNAFANNGQAPSGNERGGINIEHGVANRIEGNTFVGDAIGVRLWTDEDPHLAALPWVKANGPTGTGSAVVGNTFKTMDTAIELTAERDDCVGANTFEGVSSQLQADESSRATLRSDCSVSVPDYRPAPLLPDGRPYPGTMGNPDLATLAQVLPGRAAPVKLDGQTVLSARSNLGGREAIVMAGSTPFDWSGPTLVKVRCGGARDEWRMIGGTLKGSQVTGDTESRTTMSPTGLATVYMELPGTAGHYDLLMRFARGTNGALIARGVIAPTDWTIRVFPLDGDPVADPAAFGRAAGAATPNAQGFELAFPFGGGGPSEVRLTGPGAPVDQFGIRATAQLTFPAGCYTMVTRSDDGIRVKVDGTTYIQRWDRHGATIDRVQLDFTELTEVDIQVDYFELDGAAVLELWFEACPDGPEVRRGE